MQPVWEKDPFKVYLKDNIIELIHNQLKIVEIHSIEFNFIKPDTIKVERVEADKVILN
jgi:hypothetical protein